MNVLRFRCITQKHFLTSCVKKQLRLSSSIEHTLQVRKDIDHQRELSRQGGGPKRIDSQHKKVSKAMLTLFFSCICLLSRFLPFQGKLTARERVDLLCDDDSFVEYDAFAEHTCTDFGMDKEKVV